MDDAMAPVPIPIEDVIDLHTFQPRDVPSLLDEYFRECIRNGIYSVRVIHGKGKGILKRGVIALLDRHELVQSYSQAPGDGGGWGALLVELQRPAK